MQLLFQPLYKWRNQHGYIFDFQIYFMYILDNKIYFICNLLKYILEYHIYFI